MKNSTELAKFHFLHRKVLQTSIYPDSTAARKIYKLYKKSYPISFRFLVYLQVKCINTNFLQSLYITFLLLPFLQLNSIYWIQFWDFLLIICVRKIAPLRISGRRIRIQRKSTNLNLERYFLCTSYIAISVVINTSMYF